jgi:hypothetical protein
MLRPAPGMLSCYGYAAETMERREINTKILNIMFN